MSTAGRLLRMRSSQLHFFRALAARSSIIEGGRLVLEVKKPRDRPAVLILRTIKPQLQLITGTTASYPEGPAMTRSRQQGHKQTVPSDNMHRVQKRNSPNRRQTRLRLGKQKGILSWVARLPDDAPEHASVAAKASRAGTEVACART